MAINTWTGATSNNFSDPTNWSLDAVPSYNTGYVLLNGADVQFSTGTTLMATLEMGNNTTFEALGNMTLSPYGYIEGTYGGTDNFTVKIDGGTITDLGDISGYGTFNGTLVFNGGGVLDVAKTVSYGYVDIEHGSAFTISAGGTLQVGNYIDAAGIGSRLAIFSPVTADSYGAGTIEISNTATVEIGASVAASLTTLFVTNPNATGTPGGTLLLDIPSSFASSISGFSISADTVDLAGVATGATGTASLTFSETGGVATVTVLKPTAAGTVVAGTLTFKDPSGSYAAANAATGGFSVASDGATGYFVTTTAACFAAGTRIATVHGPVAVEDLRVGDQVCSAFGGSAAVIWLGHRRVDCARHPRPEDVYPVRVQAGAFGPGQPSADLRLSPDHAVHVDGRLVPVRYLVNGATIRQEAVDGVTYWHVELPAHDVLLAEGLPCESYLDTGNRAAFAGQPVVMAHPDFALRVWEAESCAPLLTDPAATAPIRARLLARAIALGHRMTDDPALVILADGQPVAATPVGETLLFRLPAQVRNVRLVSRSTVPARLAAGAADHRSLGVAVAAIVIDGAALPLEDARLCRGWHLPEGHWRWTDGDAVLPAGREIVIEVAMATRYWLPARAA